jgi:hypothetical protein
VLSFSRVCISVAIFLGTFLHAQQRAFYVGPINDSVDSQPGLRRSDQMVLRPIRPFSTIGLAVTAGTLGLGAQIATPLAQRANLRVGGNFFRYTSPEHSDDGIRYNAAIKLRSAEALVDWFPFGNGFHISPGVQIYNGFGGSAKLFVPSGQGFELNKTDYLSSDASPVTGSATAMANKVSPMLLIGWGNLIPRGYRHISVPFEIGGTYEGAPRIAMKFSGTACDTDNENCLPVATDPVFQANLAAQQKKVNGDVSGYRFYPVVSIGFAFKF